MLCSIGGSRSFVESTDPAVYAKIRIAVIIGNPKSGDIICLFTQVFATLL